METPPRPSIFFGRDGIVKDIVNILLRPQQRHVALIGPGGIGKTSIAKAVLNEELIVSMFHARIFLTFDDVAYSMMTYQTFLDRIAEAIGIPVSTRIAIMHRLKKLQSILLVVDNAEIFVECGPDAFRDISKMLDSIGTLSRIIFTTRVSDTVPSNLVWSRIQVDTLEQNAAFATFSATYELEVITQSTERIIEELEYHPLSINILANAAAVNRWPLKQLEENWLCQRKSSILETAKDRYHSVGIAFEISVSCSAFDETRVLVMKLLRAVSFLPEGIHRRDLDSILQIDSAIKIAESICRCSLAYWRGDRLTVLSPIRIYIMEQHNIDLSYEDELITSIRHHFHSQLEIDPAYCAREEHANIDRIFHFDLSHQFVRARTLPSLIRFISGLNEHSPQPTSVWELLEQAQPGPEFDGNEAFNTQKADAMIQMGRLSSNINHGRNSIKMFEAAEFLCRSAQNLQAQLAESLYEKCDIYLDMGRIACAEKYAKEGHDICEAIGDRERQGFAKLALVDCALERGGLQEAEAHLRSAESLFIPECSGWRFMLIRQMKHSLMEEDYNSARSFMNKAIDNDLNSNGGRRHLQMLVLKAAVEAKGGDTLTAVELLDEATATEIIPGVDGLLRRFWFINAIRGKAYYAAIDGDIQSARQYAARATVLALESGSGETYCKSLLMSGCIELLSHDHSEAINFLRSALDVERAYEEALQLEAMIYRALGEAAIQGKDANSAKGYFTETVALCDRMGIAPEYLYGSEFHWYTLPDARFPGWAAYISQLPSQ